MLRLPLGTWQRRAPFVGNPLVVDTTTTTTLAVTLKDPRDVLLGRCPHMAVTDLNCQNTNNSLPYLDLVCELLEDAVAHDAGPGLSRSGRARTCLRARSMPHLLSTATRARRSRCQPPRRCYRRLPTAALWRHPWCGRNSAAASTNPCWIRFISWRGPPTPSTR